MPPGELAGCLLSLPSHRSKARCRLNSDARASNSPVQTQTLILPIGGMAENSSLYAHPEGFGRHRLAVYQKRISAHPEYRQVRPSARAARHGHELMVKPTQQWSGSSLR